MSATTTKTSTPTGRSRSNTNSSSSAPLSARIHGHETIPAPLSSHSQIHHSRKPSSSTSTPLAFRQHARTNTTASTPAALILPHRRSRTNTTSSSSGPPSSRLYTVHRRTATSSSGSTAPLSARSGTSVSTSVHSDPFLHAEELDTTIAWIPSFYLAERERDYGSSPLAGAGDESPVAQPGPDSETREAERRATAVAPRRLPGDLLPLIRGSGLDVQVKERFMAVTRMVKFVGSKMFPGLPSSAHLSPGLRDDILEILEDLSEWLDEIMQVLAQGIKKAEEAMEKVPKGEEEEEEVGLDVQIRNWVDAVESLHHPTGQETRIFRRLASFFEEGVYVPFIQSQRLRHQAKTSELDDDDDELDGPSHNSHSSPDFSDDELGLIELEDCLADVCWRFRNVAARARLSDRKVRDVETAFEAVVRGSGGCRGAGNRDKAVKEKGKEGHRVSRSAPVLFEEEENQKLAKLRLFVKGRQREKTF